MPPERRRDPVDTLVWLVNQLSGRGIGLSAGQVATLGAAIAGVPMGRSVTAEVGLGKDRGHRGGRLREPLLASGAEHGRAGTRNLPAQAPHTRRGGYKIREIWRGQEFDPGYRFDTPVPSSRWPANAVQSHEAALATLRPAWTDGVFRRSSAS